MQLIHGACLEEMKNIPDKSVDAVIADPPYNITACKWDIAIPFEPMWEQLNRLIKPNGAIVLFGSEPFSSALRMSNIKNYKYDWIWVKNRGSNFANVKYMPWKQHENISVFYKILPTYNAQKKYRSKSSLKRVPIGKTRTYLSGQVYEQAGLARIPHTVSSDGLKNPDTILYFNVEQKIKLKFKHATQKPLALMEYLIKTYTNEHETVLDFTMGSGTAGVACKKLGREFIGIEKDPEYFKIAQERISQPVERPLF